MSRLPWTLSSLCASVCLLSHNRTAGCFSSHPCNLGPLYILCVLNVMDSVILSCGFCCLLAHKCMHVCCFMLKSFYLLYLFQVCPYCCLAFFFFARIYNSALPLLTSPDGAVIWRMLTYPPTRRALLVGCGLQMFQPVSGINTVMWVTLAHLDLRLPPPILPWNISVMVWVLFFIKTK